MSTSDRRPGRRSSRDKLLDAAADLVTREGVQNLTIEAVAAAADVTKGGLIYHFKTRDDLLAALIERMVQEWDLPPHPQHARPDADGSLKVLLTGLTDVTFDMSEERRRLLTNMLAAASSHPHLLGPVQALYARVYEGISQYGPQAGQAMILAAATDGIALLELLNLHRFTPQQRQAMREALESAIRELP